MAIPYSGVDSIIAVIIVPILHFALLKIYLSFYALEGTVSHDKLSGKTVKWLSS